MVEKTLVLRSYEKFIFNDVLKIDCEKGCFNCKCYTFCDMKGNGVKPLKSKELKFKNFLFLIIDNMVINGRKIVE